MKALRINQVIEKTGLSRSSIYALCKKGEFPKQAHLGRTIVGWMEEEVDKWLHDRKRSMNPIFPEPATP